MIRCCDDDLSYLAWTAAHPDGFILNVRRLADPDYVILHRAGCNSISNDTQAPGAFTGRSYRKICAASVAELHSPLNARGGVAARFRGDAVSAAHVRFWHIPAVSPTANDGRIRL